MGVRLRHVQGLTLFLAVSCAPLRPIPRSDFQRYLHDASFRRARLETSLTRDDNDYARLRLAHYANAEDDGWDALPTWNPKTAAEGEREEDARPISIGREAMAGDERALRALGEQAFFRYPMQRAPYAADDAARFGLTLGVVRAQLADGSFASLMSCASCHVRLTATGPVVGAPNDSLQLGELIVATARKGHGEVTAETFAPFATWGRGRVDVTTSFGLEPVRIPDLRPIRWHTHLHASGSVLQRSEIDLAIRIETLIITAHDQVLRPPREIALGLAVYLWSLDRSLPRPEPTIGRAWFGRHCGGCHRGEGMAGPVIAAEVVGTDATIARSADRGTGGYRTPSLRGVSTRGPLFHDASLPSIEGIFDKARAGHRYGFELPVEAQTEILAFLRCL